MKILLIGGHGKVALLTEPLLVDGATPWTLSSATPSIATT